MATRKIAPKDPQTGVGKAATDKTVERNSTCLKTGHRRVGRNAGTYKVGP
jgi:hypothetical protein